MGMFHIPLLLDILVWRAYRDVSSWQPHVHGFLIWNLHCTALIILHDSSPNITKAVVG